MADLKEGDRIRIYSPAGRPLELGGEETFIALSNSYKNRGLWATKVKTTH